VLDTEVDLRPQELAMAQSLIESLSSDFEPDAFEDEYAKALGQLVDAKLEGAAPAPVAADEAAGSTEVVDLLTALQRSVEKARAGRGEAAADAPAAPAARKAPAAAKAPATAKRASAAAKKAPAAAKTPATAKKATAAAKAPATAKKAPAKRAPRKSA
jgi:DNA end-binding protein Ku